MTQSWQGAATASSGSTRICTQGCGAAGCIKQWSMCPAHPIKRCQQAAAATATSRQWQQGSRGPSLQQGRGSNQQHQWTQQATQYSNSSAVSLHIGKEPAEGHSQHEQRLPGRTSTTSSAHQSQPTPGRSQHGVKQDAFELCATTRRPKPAAATARGCEELRPRHPVNTRSQVRASDECMHLVCSGSSSSKPC